jgi:hypothetical protein
VVRRIIRSLPECVAVFDDLCEGGVLMEDDLANLV